MKKSIYANLLPKEKKRFIISFGTDNGGSGYGFGKGWGENFLYSFGRACCGYSGCNYYHIDIPAVLPVGVKGMRRQSPNVCKQLLGSLPAGIKEADNGAKDKQEIKTKPSGNVITAICTLLQRSSLFLLTSFIYQGFGLSGHGTLLIMALQASVYISVDMLPLPGSQGKQRKRETWFPVGCTWVEEWLRFVSRQAFRRNHIINPSIHTKNTAEKEAHIK
mgnify:CR=1 FL=1